MNASQIILRYRYNVSYVTEWSPKAQWQRWVHQRCGWPNKSLKLAAEGARGIVTVATLASAALLSSCAAGGAGSAGSAPNSQIGAQAPAATLQSRPAAQSLTPPPPVGLTPAASDSTTTVFSATSSPGNASESDSQPVEVGVKFSSSQAGTVTAIRFYKGSKNTGSHVGHLWDSSGKLLASATFSGESAGGWQQVNLSSPVAVAANAMYTVSYHTSVGYYAADVNYFNNPVAKSPLTVPSNGGVYAYGSASSFPRSVYEATNYWVDLVFNSKGTPSPGPSSTASSSGDLASTLCVGGSKYALDDHDWFDRDSTLSVSDTWPASGGAEWSNRFSWARYNNVGLDLSYYASTAQLAPGGFTSGGLPPVAVLKPGVGVELKAYPVPRPTTAAENNTMSAQSYLAGLLSNSKAYSSGYWTYSAQLPGGNGWFPALWLLSENGGPYYELDNLEAWGPNVLGPNVVAQAEQGPTKLQQWTTIPTVSTAQHSYGAIVASNYVGFYVDNVPTTKRYTRYQTTPLNPVMNLSVCSSSTWCGPAPNPGVSGQMVVRYYAHYSPPATPAPCAPNDVATPEP